MAKRPTLRVSVGLTSSKLTQLTREVADASDIHFSITLVLVLTELKRKNIVKIEKLVSNIVKLRKLIGNDLYV